MFSMQINVFAVIHTDVMVVVQKTIAILAVPEIQQKHVEEHGEIRFTEQICKFKNLRLKYIVQYFTHVYVRTKSYMLVLCY